jgi:hypothetical protein
MKAAIATALFSRGGTALLPMLENGAAGLDEFGRAAERVGAVMSTKAAEAADALDDALADLKLSATGASNAIGESLAASLTYAAEQSTKLFAFTRALVLQHERLVATVFKAGAIITSVGAGMVAAGLAIRGLGLAYSGLAAGISAAMGAIGSATALVVAALNPVVLLSAGVAALGAYLLATSEVGGAALSWLSGKFNDLKTAAKDSLAGISDALAVGDFAAAARVLWAGINLEFQKGVAAIQGVWQGWKTAFQIVGIEAFAGVRKAWLQTRDWFESNFPNFTAGLAKAWAALTATMKDTFESVTHFVSDQMLKVMARFDKSIDLAAALKENQRQSDTNRKQINVDEAGAVAEANRRRDRSEAERKAELAASLRGVDEESAKAIEAAAMTSANSIRAAQESLDKARAEYQELVKQAQDQNKNIRPSLESNKLVSLSMWGVSAINDLIMNGVEEVAPRFGAAGTFNASAAAQIGPGNGVERTAKATEQSAKTLQDILREIRENGGGLEFE